MVFRYFKAGLFLIFTFSLFGVKSKPVSGSALFPSPRLTEPYTAQTLGKGNNQIEVSSNHIENDFLETFFSSIEYTRGLSDNFDLAVFIDIQTDIIGLEGKYQRIRNEPHTLSILMGVGGLLSSLLQEKNPYTKGTQAYEQYQSQGFVSYIGPIYSFKPNEKYELALNIRTNYSSSDAVFLSNLAPKSAKGILDKIPVHFLYGSADISNTWWWIGPRFGATVSLGLLYSFLILGKDEIKFIKVDMDPIPKLGFNFHYKF